MQRSATSCFAKHIAAFLVRPFGEYPAFLVLTALLPLVPDIIRFFLNEMSFVPGRNLFYGTLLSLFRAWLLVLPLCLRQHDRGGEILAVRIAEAIYRVFVLSCLGLLSLAESFLLIRFGTPFSFSVIQLLWETDGRESLEFLKTYCTTPAFLLPAAACVLLTAGYCWRNTGRFGSNCTAARYAYRSYSCWPAAVPSMSAGCTFSMRSPGPAIFRER